MTKRRHFWSHWPHASQQRFFRLAQLGTITCSLAVLVGLRLFTAAAEETVAQAMEQHARVVPIVTEIRTLRAQKGELVDLSPKDAARTLVDELGLDERLDSLRLTELAQDDIGASIEMSGLTLTQITDLLSALRDRANLQTPEFAVSRNPDDPRLADLRMVVAR